MHELQLFKLIFPINRFDRLADKSYVCGAIIAAKLNYDNGVEDKYLEQVNIGSWYTVKVVVEENLDTSSIYVNEHLMTCSQKMRLPYYIGGGIVLSNGHDTAIYFKHLQIVPEAGINQSMESTNNNYCECVVGYIGFVCQISI